MFWPHLCLRKKNIKERSPNILININDEDSNSNEEDNNENDDSLNKMEELKNQL